MFFCETDKKWLVEHIREFAKPGGDLSMLESFLHEVHMLFGTETFVILHYLFYGGVDTDLLSKMVNDAEGVELANKKLKTVLGNLNCGIDSDEYSYEMLICINLWLDEQIDTLFNKFIEDGRYNDATSLILGCGDIDQDRARNMFLTLLHIAPLTTDEPYAHVKLLTACMECGWDSFNDRMVGYDHVLAVPDESWEFAADVEEGRLIGLLKIFGMIDQ